MLKEIDMTVALARLKDGSDQICAIVPVTKETTLNELMNARGFAMVSGDSEPKPERKAAPKPEKKNVDHGKIIALHNAGWTATAIAAEINCSIPTVTSHIKAEKEKGE